MKIGRSKGPIETIKMKTRSRGEVKPGLSEWWLEDEKHNLASALCGTAAYLKTGQTWRIRQIAAAIRLYAGLPVYSYAGSNIAKMDENKALPQDRPTYNLIQSGTDTLVSRLGQTRPAPKFLTDNGDYKQRLLADRLNHFILGEFYQTKAYEKAVQVLRDAVVLGTGAMKIYENDKKQVALDRVSIADLYVDQNDALNGDPHQMYQLKLMDRNKVIALFPEKEKMLKMAQTSVPDIDMSAGKSLVDQIMVVEAWKLPSAEGQKDGRHTIACMDGVLFDEVYDKSYFPFCFINFSDPFRGFWGKGLGHYLFGTQMGLDRLLYTIYRSIQLVGTPRIFVEEGSKVASAHLNNEIGTIIKYRGVKPTYETLPSNAPDMYSERTNLIQLAYQQAGVSQMQASGQKPTGLTSGEAQRVYDDIATDRQATLARKYDDLFIDLAYRITNLAKEIAQREGTYQTIYPNKDGTKNIDLPQMKFLNDPFVIQCFNESSLPRDPAGRAQSIIERVQSGMLTLREGRRLLGNLDSDQIDKLSNAAEERIFKILDEIVEEANYTPPDQWMDCQLAMQLTTQYYNLYVAAKLEEDKAQMLRDFYTQCSVIVQASQPPQMMAGPMMGPPTALPQPNVTNPMIPNTAAGAAFA